MTKEDFYLALIAKGETEEVEFKSTLLNEENIAKILIAFANTNGGYLLVGVEDGGKVDGMADELYDSYMSRLKNICSSIFSYPYEIDGVTVKNRSIISVHVYRVPEHLAPLTSSKGELFIREGTKIILDSIDKRSSPKLTSKIKKEVVGFIAMSFKNEEEPSLIDYYNAMLRAALRTQLPIKLTRIDLREGDFEISQQLMHEIEKCDFILADFTFSAHNVYFEAGFARGVKKRIIQTARKDTVLQFDVRNWITLFYRNATELEEKLIVKLVTVYQEITS